MILVLLLSGKLIIYCKNEDNISFIKSTKQNNPFLINCLLS